MEQLAPPGSILLTAAALRLVEGLVRVNALGPIPIKGLLEPVEGVRADWYERHPIPRLQAVPQPAGSTRFVGRQTELVALRQALQRAGAGHGRGGSPVVGEAGAWEVTPSSTSSSIPIIPATGWCSSVRLCLLWQGYGILPGG